MASVTLEPGRALDGAAAAALARLVDGQPGGVPHLARQIEAGGATLWAASVDGVAAGWMVTQTSSAPDGREFWITYAVGGDARSPIAPACLEAIEEHARAIGCVRLVFWTQRRGLAALAAARGYRVSLVAEVAL